MSRGGHLMRKRMERIDAEIARQRRERRVAFITGLVAGVLLALACGAGVGIAFIF